MLRQSHQTIITVSSLVLIEVLRGGFGELGVSHQHELRQNTIITTGTSVCQLEELFWFCHYRLLINVSVGSLLYLVHIFTTQTELEIFPKISPKESNLDSV